MKKGFFWVFKTTFAIKLISFNPFWVFFKIFLTILYKDIVVNLYLTRVILSEYFKEYLLSIGALIKLIYKYVKS